MRLATDMIEQMSEIFCQPLVRFEVVRRVMETNAAVAIEQDSVLRVRQVLRGQQEIERMAGKLASGEAREQAVEHRRIGLAEHLDVTEREIFVLRPK
jgi:DNA mismatch repair ATPase MutS